MTEEKKSSSIIKPIILMLLLFSMPMIAVKCAKQNKKQDNGPTTTMTQAEVENVVSNYIKNHPEELLETVTNQYYEKFVGIDKSDKINNAIAAYSKILFDEKLPQLGNKNEMRILMIFSDFDLAEPMLEKINEFPNSLKVRFYFRQMITQTKFSAITARYGYAVNQIDSSKYVPYYLSVLKVPKKELDIEKIESIIKNMDLDITKIKEIAESPETEKLALQTTDISMQLGIDQLPVFILENGRILFGINGFEILQNMMK